MAKQETIEGKLTESIVIKDVGDLVSDYAELGLDSILDDGLVKDIPILRTFVSIAKAGKHIRDILYVKKIACFLKQVGQTTQKQRDDFIEKHCKDQRRFEEAVFLILEQVDNINKSTLIGKIFKACILGMISYQDALSLSCIVNKALWQDIENMLQDNFTEEMSMRLCNCGLLNLGLMRSRHIDETMEPFVTEEKIDALGYHKNKYFRMLMETAKL
jgi:hypothetical protein